MVDVSFPNMAAFDRFYTELPAAIRAAVDRANDNTAEEFKSLVERIVPRDTDSDVHLADTLAKGAPSKGTGVAVSIGGDAAPFPAHLEWGHMTKGGKHVPAKPFWFPALRLIRKKLKARANRAARDAIKRLKPNDG